jgi:Ca2+/Na+ antiporter
MSPFSLAAISVYVGISLLCTLAALSAGVRGHSRRHALGWLLCSAAFIAMAVLRLLGAEDRIRQALRKLALAQGSYEERAVLQAPLVVLILAGMILLVFGAQRVWRSKLPENSDRLLGVALLSVAAFVPLYAVRMISWHTTDRILYGGGIHLNWILDLGLCAAVAGVAILYLRPSRSASARAAPIRRPLKRPRRRR